MVPSVELLANLQWTSLETRRINSKLLFVYKIINGHTAYEINSDLIMKRNAHIISETGERYFNYRAAVLWNDLPYQAKIAPTVWSFEKLIQQV